MGFFSDHTELEEDDFEDFVEVARSMKTAEDIYFACVLDEDVADHFKKTKLIDRTPSFLLVDDRGEYQTINANELNDGEGGALAVAGIADWIRHKAVPTVGHLTGVSNVIFCYRRGCFVKVIWFSSVYRQIFNCTRKRDGQCWCYFWWVP